MKTYKITNLNGGFVVYKDNEPEIHLNLDDVFKDISLFYEKPYATVVEMQETVNDKGQIMRSWTVPALPGIPAKTYSIPVKVKTIAEEKEMEEKANDPVNPNYRKQDTKPEEDPGDGYYWQLFRTVCGNLWKRTTM